MRTPGRPLRPSRAWQLDHPWSAVYDRLVRPGRVAALAWRIGTGGDAAVLHRIAAAELAAAPAGAIVLDVPCGGGTVLRDVPAGARLRYVAADIAPTMLRRTQDEARRLGLAGLRTVQADVAELPLPDASVDLVLSFTSLHCLDRPRDALGELARVLVPGGRIAWSAVLTDCPWPYRAVWPAGRTAGVLGHGCSTAELRTWAAASGLADVRLVAAGALTYATGTRAR